MIHIGIIPDGNRRWCKKNNIELKDTIQIWTHKFLDLLTELLGNIDENKKKYKKYKKLKKVNEVSLYVCSIDNLKRNDDTMICILKFIENINEILFTKTEHINEVNFRKIQYYLEKININIIGDIDLFPENIQNILNKLKRKNEEVVLTINLAIGYNYENDLLSYKNNNFIHYNREQSNIDLLFRSGGEKRISGFFPTKMLYSELFFYNKLWPDITLNDFNKIIKKYLKRDRRFGK